MKLSINYDGLAAINGADAQRSALFASLKAAMLLPVLMNDVLGADEAAAASMSGGKSIMHGGSEGLTTERVKAYLQSDRAARHGAKWATPGDNPLLQTTSAAVVSFYASNVREMDLGYQVLFDEVPGMLGSNQDSFEIRGASMGFTWEQIKPGGAIKPRRNINETSAAVKYLTFGDGFSILDEWFQFSKYYHIADAINEYMSTYYDRKAALHYGLLTGLGTGINVAFATDAQTTFNAAVSSILRKVEAKGYAVGSNPQVDIVVSPERVGYVLAFLEASRGSTMVQYGVAKQPVAFSVRNVIVTTKVTAADTGYYVVLPGRKLKRADWKALTIESKREPSVAAEDWYGRGQYNAVVGDQDQVARVAFS